MHDNIPEPIGDLDWGLFITDIMAGIPPNQDDFEVLKETIHQEIKTKLHSACLWFLQYKDSPKEYLIDQDVDLEFMRDLINDPGLNQTSIAFQEHVLFQAFIGKKQPKTKRNKVPASYDVSLMEYRNGKLCLRLKIDPPHPFQIPTQELNELGLPDKKLYTTGDICQILELHPDTFRYRLRSGIYPEAKHRAGDKRRFTYDEVAEIVRITKAKSWPKYKSKC